MGRRWRSPGWRFLTVVALLVTVSPGLAAQETLSLADAIRTAKANNPGYLATQNDLGPSTWQVREAYGQFIPSLRASGSVSYTEGGTQRIGTLDFGTQGTDWYSSGYSLSLGWTLNGTTLFGVSNAKANQRATAASVDAAGFNLETQVAFQYMSALRAADALDIASRQLERARQNHALTTVRVATGAVAGTDANAAEVGVGRAEVALINAERDLRQSRLLLAEQLGLAISEDTQLSDEFGVFEPEFNVEELLGTALLSHPSLNAFVAREQAIRATARQVVTNQYLPSLSVGTSFRGNTLQALNEDFLLSSAESSLVSQQGNCEFTNQISAGLSQPLPGYPRDCSGLVFSEADRARTLAGNDVFPFNFTRLPVSLSLIVSIPIFAGFSQQRQIAEAQAAAGDATFALRAEELRLRTAVTAAHDNLTSAYRIVAVEARNQAVADEQLQLQQRRYSLGAAPLLELMDAQTASATADQASLSALYDFHYSLIALEAAVGQPLRPR